MLDRPLEQVPDDLFHADGVGLHEKRLLAEPGGRAAVHHQDGFTFDAGPTIVTAPHLFEELWQLAGKRLADDVELKALDPFYEIRFDDGAVFRAGRGDGGLPLLTTGSALSLTGNEALWVPG